MAWSACGGSDDRDACKRFLGCVAESSPDKLPGLMETYGSGGTCWQATEIAAGCGDFCRARMRELAIANVSVAVSAPRVDPGVDPIDIELKHESCVECQTDDHCADDARPGCHVASGLCVQCTTDVHCQAPVTPAEDEQATGGLFSTIGGDPAESPAPAATNVSCDGSGTCVTIGPADGDDDSEPSGTGLPSASALAHCAVDRGVCVECQTDAHCADPRYPHCSRGSGLCGACSTDAHCPKDMPVCVIASSPLAADGYAIGTPYGYDASGPNGRDGGRSYCTGCRNAGDCSPDAPHCDEVQQRCVQCRNTSDCGGNGTCNPETGRCEQSCSEVMACMRSECGYGCADPNALCSMLQCANAKALAQCIATHCVDCYRSGWYDSYASSFDCEACIAKSCSPQQTACDYDGC